MNEFELWFCGFAIFAIGVLFWQMGKPWADEYQYWTHACRRKAHYRDNLGGHVNVDLPEGQDCPWCGKQESDYRELP